MTKHAYVINLAVAAPVWRPRPWQQHVFYNPNWLNSVWLGTVWSLVSVPRRLWDEVVMVGLHFSWWMAIKQLVAFPWHLLMMAVMGFCSNLRGTSLPIEVMTSARFMDFDEAMNDVKNGPGLMLRSAR